MIEPLSMSTNASAFRPAYLSGMRDVERPRICIRPTSSIDLTISMDNRPPIAESRGGGWYRDFSGAKPGGGKHRNLSSSREGSKAGRGRIRGG